MVISRYTNATENKSLNILQQISHSCVFEDLTPPNIILVIQCGGNMSSKFSSASSLCDNGRHMLAHYLLVASAIFSSYSEASELLENIEEMYYMPNDLQSYNSIVHVSID